VTTENCVIFVCHLEIDNL